MHRVITAFVLSAAFLATAAFGQTDAATAELLLRKSGTWEQLASLEPQVRAEFGQAMAAATPKPSQAESERLAKVISSAYATAKLRATAARVVASSLDEKHLPAILQWYGSATGQAMTKLEEEFTAATANADPQVVATQGAEVFGQSSELRRNLIVDLVRETKATEGLVEITLNAALAIQRGVLASNPNAPGITAAEMRASLEQQRPVLMQAYEGLIRANFALMYKSVSDQDLEQYVGFLKSAAGAHFGAVLMAALDRAFAQASEELGANLVSTKDKART